MTRPKNYFLIHDKTAETYFTTVVFPDGAVAVSFPADPAKSTMLGSATYWDRLLKVSEATAEKGLTIDWAKWTYFEVSPYSERLLVRKHTAKSRRKFLTKEIEWEEAIANEMDMERLDVLAKDNGLPTIGEYYRQVCEDRKAVGALESAAHEMISAWTRLWPSTAELLAQLQADEADRGYLLSKFQHGWYYTVTRGEKKEYFRAKGTAQLLRSFIVHAQEAEKRQESVRFAYCLREYMPDGINWQQSPA